jgi:hypothetical protein
MVDNCPERQRLSSVVDEAIPKIDKAKADYDRARKAKSSDVDALASVLVQARRDARTAERALRKHIEKHQCLK